MTLRHDPDDEASTVHFPRMEQRAQQHERYPDLPVVDEDTARAVLARNCGPYVYILFRETGQPFYVGKGNGNTRALEHVSEARRTGRLTHKLNVIRAIERTGGRVRYAFEFGFASESDALARERALIAGLGRHDLKKGPLTNQTDGGEGTSNPSEESRRRRRETLWGEAGDDAERNLANRWFQSIVSVSSVPVKSIGRYRVEAVFRNRDSFAMSARQAGALAASAIANRVLLEPGCDIPRRIVFGGVEMIIENGVGRDIISSGMARLGCADLGMETFRLTSAGFDHLVSAVDVPLLIDAGVLAPDFETH
ncbi:MAG: GIY-YIG nuclease family protein [Pseudomonadota bacterium]